MPQVRQNPYDEVKVPFAKMSFAPDIPSAQLGPNEYNSGYNVETDIRGIRSVSGDTEILTTVPGTPTYISGGYRYDGKFWFVVAVTEGKWYANNGTTGWTDITPGGRTFTGYTQATNITEGWNGNVAFFNDTINPPMFWPDQPGASMILYSNTIPASISDIVYIDSATMQIQISNSPYTSIPYQPGDQILIANVNSNFNGVYTVVSSTEQSINYTAQPGSVYPAADVSGTVSPAYAWNYNPNWKSYTAQWMRIYNTPNVGSILVAGNLTVTDLNDVVTTYPVTVQWSQNFGLEQAPLTWEPTVTNVANQLEVPLRGPALDAFPCNGQMYVCSYWDTVVFSPINYTTTSVPILGVRLLNQGRGMLSANCWANTDKLVYGLDSRDIWVFNGNDFQGLGNQRVKNWFYEQLDPRYVDRVFMQTNTQKNQVEIYYPTTSATNGVPNKMLSYRYDIDVWNAPRDVASATYAVESPIWTGAQFNYGSRTVSYARGQAGKKVVMQDQGYSFVDGQPIVSKFRRDNITMLKDYSGKVLVHRILPEVINLDYKGLPIDPATQPGLIGSVGITIEGANSVGQTPQATTAITVATNTNYPWAQMKQNAYRVNTIEITNSSTTNIWMCTATTWQITEVEDDR